MRVCTRPTCFPLASYPLRERAWVRGYLFCTACEEQEPGNKACIGHSVCLSQRVNLSSGQDVEPRCWEGGGGGGKLVGSLMVSSCLGGKH